jgi:hypothetical protein
VESVREHAIAGKILGIPFLALSELQAGPPVQLMDSLDRDER